METYNETRLDGKRKFRLVEDGVFVSANIVMGPSYETRVAFHQMDSAITVIRQHHQLFWPSICGIPLFVMVTFVLVDSLEFDVFDLLPGIFAGLTLIAIFVAIFTRKRIEYARFCSTAGAPVLDIARSGPDTDGFDEFIGIIKSRIEASRNAGQQDNSL